MNKSIFMKGASLFVVAGMIAPAAAQQDEIIVTATKREQTLQEVPVAVTVTDSETIDRARIFDINDLQSVVPSLRVGQLQSSTQTNFIIRGFGNGANNAGIEPSVGVFIDGVYRSRSAAQIADLPNIERVEVLRGPQSTLFGKNASAGVISVVTSKPQYEWGGYIEGGISNYNGKQAKGFLTGPLGENMAFSVGGTLNKRDGYSENLFLGTDINDRDRWSVRGQLLIEPTETTSFRITADYDELEEVCCTVANLVAGPTAGIISALGGQLDVANPFSYNVFLNADPIQRVENGGISLHSEFAFDRFDLTSITAYRNLEGANLSDDVDFSSADLIAPQNVGMQEFKTFTQEFRITSNNDGPINWLAGLYYFDEEVETQGGIFFGPQFRTYADFLTGAPGTIAAVEAAFAPFGVAPGSFFREGDGVIEMATQDNQSYSLFGTLDWELNDRLVATLGLNYTNDEKQVSLMQTNTDVFSNLELEPFGLEALNGLQFLPQLLGFPNAGETGESEDSNTDYTVRLAYDATDNINVYGSFATGFKATSWNLSRDSRPTVAERDAILAAGGTLPANLLTGTRFAGPENAEVFELGVKGNFDKGSFNVAIFDQTLEDFQFNAFTGAAFTLANAGETNVQGFEIDTTYYPTDSIVLTFAGTFLDPVYESFPASPSGDLTGQQVAGIAETSISTSATWNWEKNGYEGFIRGDYQYESEVDISDNPAQTAATAANGFSTREVNLFNASAGFSKDNYEFTVWARNLFQDEYLISAFPSVAQPGSFSGYPNPPRTYGLTIRANLN